MHIYICIYIYIYIYIYVYMYHQTDTRVSKKSTKHTNLHIKRMPHIYTLNLSFTHTLRGDTLNTYR